jgi:hypothetical protein
MVALVPGAPCLQTHALKNLVDVNRAPSLRTFVEHLVAGLVASIRHEQRMRTSPPNNGNSTTLIAKAGAA